MLTPSDFIRTTLDPTRLAILGAAAAGPVDAGDVAVRLGVPKRKIMEAVSRLREAGLLREDLMLDREALRDIARNLPPDEPAAEKIIEGAWTAEEIAVLSRFFTGARLTEIPSSRSKRLVVLERLVQEFAPGIRYPEKQVSFMLQMFHPDYAALRRYLVDEGFLTRAEGVYWRTGGRYPEAIGE